MGVGDCASGSIPRRLTRENPLWAEIADGSWAMPKAFHNSFCHTPFRRRNSTSTSTLNEFFKVFPLMLDKLDCIVVLIDGKCVRFSFA